MEKKRADQLLVERRIASDRQEAVALILSGTVLANDQRVDKPGTLLPADCGLRLKKSAERYVSRGGFKLEGALADLSLSVKGWVCVDLGASTGGFTDCLLQHGARKVYAFDVGHGQLAWKLRRDPRVVVCEGVNARFLERSMVPEPADFITVDLSFISLKRVLPALRPFECPVLALVKPQFEAERSEVAPGGLIHDTRLQEEIVDRIRAFAVNRSLSVLGEAHSRLPGQKGNREFFLLLAPPHESHTIS